MSYLGYLTWDYRVFKSFILNGYTMSDCINSISMSRGPSGIQIPMLGGGSVFQAIPNGVYAPLEIAPITFNIDVQNSGQEDYFRLRWIAAVARYQPVHFFFEHMIEDVWYIPGDSNTTWVLSRQTAFGMIDHATYTPEAYIRENDGTQTSTTATYTTTANETSITSADLSTHGGKFLVFRYHPLYLCTIESITESIEDVNGLNFSLSLNEYIAAKPWS